MEIHACPFPKIHPSQLNRDDAFYMALAYNQAIEAWREDEVPVGAVIEWGGGRDRFRSQSGDAKL